MAISKRLPRPGTIRTAIKAVLLPTGFVWLTVAFAASPAAIRNPRKAVPFWIGTDVNQVLSRQTLEFIADRATFFVLRARELGPTPDYDYRAIMQSMAGVRSDLPKLVYGSCTTLDLKTARIEKQVLSGYENLGGLLLHSSPDTVFRHGTSVYGDPTVPAYRAWLSERFAAAVDRYGGDGAALDLTYRMPYFRGDAYRRENPAEYAAYGDGIDQALTAIKAALKPKWVVYNGLWNSVAKIKLSEQEKLLAFADCASVEYFGLDPLREHDSTRSSFAADILPYLEIIRAHPEKSFLLYGRGPWRYTDYEADYLWQRYLFASYLLVARPNVSFKYHAMFQYPTGGGRTGGLDAFADSDLDFGSPTGDFERHGELYVRTFAKGLALVAPHEGPGGDYLLPRQMYDPEGRAYAGAIHLAGGQGLLLFQSIPPAPAAVAYDFDHVSAGVREIPWSAVRRDSSGNHYLHLEAAPPGRTYEHDLILDWVRTLRPPTHLHLRVRTTDGNARLFAAAEIDDPAKKHFEAVVQLGHATADAARVEIAPELLFRIEPRAGEQPGAQAPRLNAGVDLRTDGAWQDVTIELPRVSGQFEFRRWNFLRIQGNVDVEVIRLGSEEKVSVAGTRAREMIGALSRR